LSSPAAGGNQRESAFIRGWPCLGRSLRLSTLRLFAFSAVCLLLAALPARAGVGGEFAPLEAAVSSSPSDLDARTRLAEAYASSGFIEEAIAQRFAVLDQQPDNADAPARINQLLSQRVPTWLPEQAARIAPFPHSTFDPTAGRTPAFARFLLVTPSTISEEGQRDSLHHWPFPRAQYAYAWHAPSSRWILKLRAHAGPDVTADLTANALQALASFHQTALVYASWDPTASGQPIDLWITTQGAPGARAIGTNIYLYAVSTPRTPAEWLREIAHEYGHIALPGIGGFTNTDDPWADGDFAELLFLKWLSASCHPERSEGSRRSWEPGPPGDTGVPPQAAISVHRSRVNEARGGRSSAEGLAVPLSSSPWPIASAERLAAVHRRALIAAAAGKPDLARLKANDTAARDYFLGLALRVETTAGPHLLAESLSRCPHGTAAEWVKAVSALAKERGVTLW
jgi:hypothetical protein